jgi:hypothetical protein
MSSFVPPKSVAANIDEAEFVSPVQMSGLGLEAAASVSSRRSRETRLKYDNSPTFSNGPRAGDD